MAVDSTPAYGPTRSLLSTAISDSTATGRALITAASAAAARTVLGIDDVSTLLSQSIAHAKQVCNFAFSPNVWHADGVSKPGTAGGRWGTVILSAGSTNVADVAGETGGGWVLTTSGASGGIIELLSVPNGLGLYGASLMPDLVAAASRWHVEYDFRVNSTPDAQTNLGCGWAKPDSTQGPVLGIQGASSTTKWRLFTPGGSGVSSTVNIDTARHKARIWANGATPGTIFFSVDGETPVSIASVAWGQAACPYMFFGNGTTLAAQNLNLWNAIYVTEGVT